MLSSVPRGRCRLDAHSLDVHRQPRHPQLPQLPWTFGVSAGCKGLTAAVLRSSMVLMDEDEGPEPQPPKDLNLGLLLLLGGLFFLFVLLAGLVGLTP